MWAGFESALLPMIHHSQSRAKTRKAESLRPHCDAVDGRSCEHHIDGPRRPCTAGARTSNEGNVDMRVRIGLVTSVVLALALPAGAQAALPTTHSTLIVPVKSLAGVKLGASLASATAAWGKGGTCSENGGACIYESTNDKDGSASFLVAQTSTTAPVEVVNVSIKAGLTSRAVGAKKNFNTPLDRFKTAKGIGIGSTASKLKHAYPHLKKSITGIYNLAGPGESFTLFEVEEGRVAGISIQSIHLG
jgi:hypothetical protein